MSFGRTIKVPASGTPLHAWRVGFSIMIHAPVVHGLGLTASSRLHLDENQGSTMRFGSTLKVLAKRMPKYHRMS